MVGIQALFLRVVERRGNGFTKKDINGEQLFPVDPLEVMVVQYVETTDTTPINLLGFI